MLDKVKLALRIRNTAYDSEIQLLIDSCKADLFLAGVDANKKVAVNSGGTTVYVTDPLIEQAVLLYCKGNFGYDESSTRFNDAYLKLKIALNLSVEYGVRNIV